MKFVAYMAFSFIPELKRAVRWNVHYHVQWRIWC